MRDADEAERLLRHSIGELLRARHGAAPSREKVAAAPAQSATPAWCDLPLPSTAEDAQPAVPPLGFGDKARVAWRVWAAADLDRALRKTAQTTTGLRVPPAAQSAAGSPAKLKVRPPSALEGAGPEALARAGGAPGPEDARDESTGPVGRLLLGARKGQPRLGVVRAQGALAALVPEGEEEEQSWAGCGWVLVELVVEQVKLASDRAARKQRAGGPTPGSMVEYEGTGEVEVEVEAEVEGEG